MVRKKKSINGNNNGHSDNGNGEYKLLREFKPKTPNQHDYVRSIAENDIVLCTGPSGCGKTAVCVALACEYLVYGKVDKIVITRPTICVGKGLGAFPGTALEKVSPYLTPILDEMSTYFTEHEINKLIDNKVIDIAPLEIMRGRNFHRSFSILDEAQNCTLDQIKMFITRIGSNSKCVINGDLRQSDLNVNGSGIGLKTCIDKLQGLSGLSIVELNHTDIIRNSIISSILERLEK